MYLSLDGEVSAEMFRSLIEAYNKLKEKEWLVIYLNSSGGDPDASQAITTLINKNATLTEIIAYGRICSAAFDIFFKSECERYILHNTVGMAHVTGVLISVTDGPIDDSDKVYIKYAKEDKDMWMNFYKELGFKSSELSKIKDGKDVWFDYKRLRQFLNNQ